MCICNALIKRRNQLEDLKEAPHIFRVKAMLLLKDRKYAAVFELLFLPSAVFLCQAFYFAASLPPQQVLKEVVLGTQRWLSIQA